MIKPSLNFPKDFRSNVVKNGIKIGRTKYETTKY